MGEITDDTNRVIFLGGVLYDPCKQYPSVFGSSSFLEKFPAFLPQVVASSFSFLAFVLAFFFLQENARKTKLKKENIFLMVYHSLKQTFSVMFTFFKPKNFWSIYCGFEYFLIGFGNTAYYTIYPLLMIANVGNGGFGYTTSEVGYFSAIQSLGGFLSTIVVYRLFVKHLNLRLTFILCIFMASLFFGIFPSLEGLNGSSGVLKWLVYAFVAFFWNMTSQSAFSSVFILIVNAADPDQMGSANGVSQSFVAVARIIGPIGLSPMMSWCLNNDLPYPFNQYLPFYILMASSLLASLLMCFTPRKINFSKKRKVAEKEVEMDDISIEITNDIRKEILGETPKDSPQPGFVATTPVVPVNEGSNSDNESNRSNISEKKKSTSSSSSSDKSASVNEKSSNIMDIEVESTSIDISSQSTI
ncbi:Major facilitator superfamily (MFS) profile domain-containing protein [Entamoeba marina]